jgi:hypothetical protein
MSASNAINNRAIQTSENGLTITRTFFPMHRVITELTLRHSGFASKEQSRGTLTAGPARWTSLHNIFPS